MSISHEFTCFGLLSQELQDMIWSHSFRPQLITLYYADCPSTQHTSSSTESDNSHLTPGGFLRSPPPPSPEQLEPINTPAPGAFSVCRASRAIAQAKGYKTWRMIRSDGKVRDLLWNPVIDTILFAGPHDSYFESFVQQFSAQASEIRSLALPYDLWDASLATKTSSDGRAKRKRGLRGLMRLLKSPSSLRKMFVMVDKEFFESEVKGKAEDKLEWWSGLGCFGHGFHSGLAGFRKVYREDSLVSPKVSIAWNFDMILRGEDVELPKLLISDTVASRLRGWSRRNQ